MTYLARAFASQTPALLGQDLLQRPAKAEKDRGAPEFELAHAHKKVGERENRVPAAQAKGAEAGEGLRLQPLLVKGPKVKNNRIQQLK